MKKEITSYEEALNYHLKPFEAIYSSSKDILRKVTGLIFIDITGEIFLLQDTVSGHSPEDINWRRFGFKCTWCQYSKNKLTITAMEHLTIDIEEQWQPKFGELVEVSNNDRTWYKRIFIGEYAGNIHCIHEEDVKFFEADTCESYRVLQWAFIRQIEEPKNIEISLEEAKSIIAKERGVDITQINLNFNIK